jgi:hypothetical protein
MESETITRPATAAPPAQPHCLSPPCHRSAEATVASQLHPTDLRSQYDRKNGDPYQLGLMLDTVLGRFKPLPSQVHKAHIYENPSPRGTLLPSETPRTMAPMTK